MNKRKRIIFVLKVKNKSLLNTSKEEAKENIEKEAK